MTTRYEIIIWAFEVMWFDIKKGSTKPNLQALEWFKQEHKLAIEQGRDSMPYMTVKEYIENGKDSFCTYWTRVFEYGDHSCDYNLEDLPKYVQNQIAPLIEYDRSIDHS